MRQSPQLGRRDQHRERQAKPHLVTYYDVLKVQPGQVFAFNARPHQPMVKNKAGTVMSLAKYRARYPNGER